MQHRLRIDALIPHRPPFRFVDEVIRIEGEEGSFALRLAENDARLRGNGLAPLFLLEALAQSTAAFHGAHLQLEPNRGSELEEGVLVQIDAAELHQRASAGDDVLLWVRRSHRLGSLVRFETRASVADTVLARADITVQRQVSDA